MPELQFVGVHSQCPAEDLIAEADAKERDFVGQHFAHHGDHLVGGGGVTRTVGYKNPIWIVAHDVFVGGVGGHHDRADTALHKVAGRVGFNAHVVGDHGKALLPFRLHHIGVVGGDVACQVRPGHTRLRFYYCQQLRLRALRILAGKQARRNGPMVAHVPHQRPRIDAPDSHDPLRRHLVFQAAGGTPVGCLMRQVTDH